jgi:hypothetical protein
MADARPFDIASVDCLHRLARVRELDPPSRHFVAECSCGERFDGGARTALPTVLRRFLSDHLEVGSEHVLHQELKFEAHHPGFNLRPYRAR